MVGIDTFDLEAVDGAPIVPPATMVAAGASAGKRNC